MFRITRDPSSGSFIQRLAKIAVMVLSCPFVLDVVGVMAAYLPVVRVCVCVCVCVCVLHSVERHCVCTAQCREALCVYCTV